MPRKKSTPEKLVSAAGALSPAKSQNAHPSIPDFYKKLYLIPDEKTAASMAKDQAENEFLSGDGAALDGLYVIKKSADTELAQIKTKITDLEYALAQTPRDIQVRTETQKALHQEGIKSPHYAFIDVLSASILLIGTVLMLAMSHLNLYAILMASGEPVFLDAPWLALTIAALAPCASIAFKMLSAFFHYRNTKKKYALCVHVVTVLLTIGWIICFSQNFSAVGASIDLDTMLSGDTGNGKSEWLVLLQLSCEIFVATSLFLALEEICLKYSPFSKAINPDYTELETALRSANKEHETVSERSKTLQERITKLESQKNTFINERMLDAYAFRARFNSLKQI